MQQSDLDESLIKACIHGELNDIKELLDQGASIRAVDEHKEFSVMHWVAWQATDCFERLKLMVEHGADVDAKDCKGLSALHSAVWNRDIECVKYLLALGIDSGICDNNGKTAMDYANDTDDASTIELISMYHSASQENLRLNDLIKSFDNIKMVEF